MPRDRPLAAILWTMLTLIAALSLPPRAVAAATPPHIAAQLVAESAGSPGGKVMLALAMQPAAGWHGYWSNPGDAGVGMRLDWQLPPGASVREPRYPVPETLLVAGLMNHVYRSAYAVLIPFTLPRNARPGSALPLSVKADWLACTDQICVPEHALLATGVAVGAPGPRDPRFDGWQRNLPAPLGTFAQMSINAHTIRLGVPLPASVPLIHPHVFAGTDRLVDYAAPQLFNRQGDLLVVTLARPPLSAPSPATFAAVLRLDDAGDGISFTAIPGPVPATVQAPGEASLPSLPWLLLAALTGGILLNIMPCVFPILSLKALSLLRSGESAAQARAEGLAYAAGVVLACVVLGGMLLALRASGQQVGWAFQLQQPLVVAALLALATAITVNLLGLFELAIPGFAGSTSPRGAFATGLLAAFVATPCTGPFMAAAMGAALLLPAPAALLLFATLGLGIALPFVAIAAVPALRQALPRPGRWMVWFRKAMALPMGLTAVALAWLASREGGWGFAGAAIAFSTALIAVLALVGREQRAGRGTGRWLLPSAGVLAALSALALPPLIRAPSAQASELLPTQPFSESALAAARAQGHPVFAWFTADWCLTCKVNERIAIERPAIRTAFARAGVVVLRGDWTRRDAAITRYLTAQGVAGVPLYVWYPASGEPRQLPQILTPDSLVQLTQTSHQ